MKNKKLAVTGAISNMLGIIAKKGLAIIISIILIRELSISEFGEFNLFVATVVMTGTIALGFDKIIQRFFPLYLAGSNPDKASSVAVILVFSVQRYIVFFLLISLVQMAMELGWIDAERFNIRHLGLAIAVGAVLAARLIFVLALNATFLEHKLVNLAYVLGDALKLLLLYVMWDGDVREAVIIWGLGEILILFMVVKRFVNRLQPLPAIGEIVDRSRELEYKRYYHYGKYMMFASTGTYILSSEIDYFFLSYYQSSEAVGIYAFASKIPMLLLALAPSHLLFNVTMPMLFRKLDNGARINEVTPAMVTLLKLSVIGWTIMAALCAVNIVYIIRYVFDPKYESAAPYVYLWFILLYPLVLKNVFEPMARALEYTRVYLFTVVAALVNLMGNYLLIPVFGIEGALISTGISMAIQGYSISYYVSRKISLKINYNYIIKSLLAITSVWTGVYLVNDMIGGSFVDRLMANGIVLLLITCVFWPYRWFKADEFAYIKSFMPRGRN